MSSVSALTLALCFAAINATFQVKNVRQRLRVYADKNAMREGNLASYTARRSPASDREKILDENKDNPTKITNKLESRTYVNDVYGFSRASPCLNVKRKGKEPLSSDISLLIKSGWDYIKLPNRLFVVFIAYNIFPVLQRIVSPMLQGINVDDLTDSINGEFSPVMQVLFAILAANTIQRLESRQMSLQKTVNEEVTQLQMLAWNLIGMLENSESKALASRGLSYIWKQTDILIFGTRALELNKVLTEDYILGLNCFVGQLAKKETQSEEAIGRIYTYISNLLQLRTSRLTQEGECLAPAIFNILDWLSFYIVISYVFLSAARELEPLDSFPMRSVESFSLNLARAFESSAIHRVLEMGGVAINAEAAIFSVLCSLLIVLKFLFDDLNQPYAGYTRLRRTVSTTGIYAIRRDIENALFNFKMGDLVEELRKGSDEASAFRNSSS